MHGRDIQAICLHEYTCGIGKVLEIREKFRDVNLIYVGGMWNSYTKEAKEYCLANEMGLFRLDHASFPASRSVVATFIPYPS